MANTQNKRTGGDPRRESMPFFSLGDRGHPVPPSRALPPPGQELVGTTPTPDDRSINLRSQVVPLRIYDKVGEVGINLLSIKPLPISLSL